MKSSRALGWSWALLGLVVLVACCTAGQHASTKKASSPTSPLIRSRLVDDDQFVPYQGERFNVFDWTLLRAMGKRYTGNVLVSPISLKLALVLLYEGAQDETARELASVMQLPINRNTTRQTYAEILRSLKTPNPNYKLNLGTQLYIDSNVLTRQQYQAIIKFYYDTDVIVANLTDTHDVAERVNAWVSGVTEGNIPKMIENEESLTDSVMLILNAMYFQGVWLRDYFKPENTQIGKFYVNHNTTVDVPYMTTVGQFYYAESSMLNAKILRIPYAGRKFAMYFVLPYSTGGIDTLINEINPFMLTRQVWLLQESSVFVYIPKFKFTFSSHLENTLRELGIREIFEDTALLTGIARTKRISRRLKVTDVYQKTGIDVNENGTTAYVATEVQIANKIGDDMFNADHPFIFYIEDETTGTTLYIGKVTNPLETESSTEGPRHPMQQQQQQPANTEAMTKAAPVPRLAERYNYFNTDLFQSLLAEDSGNLIASPASAKLALMILAEGTGGRTRQEILSALRMTDDDAIIGAVAENSMRTLQKNVNGTEVTAASRLWVRSDLNVSDDYLDVVRRNYRTDIKTVNFADSVSSATTINQWVSEATGEKIQTLVDPGSVSSDTSLLLTSALYFKGRWETSFDRNQTKVGCFNVPDLGCRNVSFMETTSKFPYTYVASLDAEVVAVPYSDNKTAMLIVLPSSDENDQELRVLSKDLSYASVSSLLSDLQTTEINLLLPKFNIESKLDLRPSLIRMGIEGLFGMSANLSGIATEESLRVSGIVQQAKIEVDEDGTVAAAATSASIVPLMSWSTQVFKANRPFVFMIVDLESRGTLFSGRLIKPN